MNYWWVFCYFIFEFSNLVLVFWRQRNLATSYFWDWWQQRKWNQKPSLVSYFYVVPNCIGSNTAPTKKTVTLQQKRHSFFFSFEKKGVLFVIEQHLLWYPPVFFSTVEAKATAKIVISFLRWNHLTSGEKWWNKWQRGTC